MVIEEVSWFMGAKHQPLTMPNIIIIIIIIVIVIVIVIIIIIIIIIKNILIFWASSVYS